MALYKLRKFTQDISGTLSELVAAYPPKYKTKSHISVGVTAGLLVKKYVNTINEYVYYLCERDNENVAGYVVVKPSRTRGHVHGSIEMLEVYKSHAGKNLAMAMYKFIVNSEGIVLQIGHAQTKGSRKLWYKLAADPSVVVFYSTIVKRQRSFFLCELNHAKQELMIGDKSPYIDYQDDNHFNSIYLSKKA